MKKPNYQGKWQGCTVLSQETKHALDIANLALIPALQRSIRRLNLTDAHPGTNYKLAVPNKS